MSRGTNRQPGRLLLQEQLLFCSHPTEAADLRLGLKPVHRSPERSDGAARLNLGLDTREILIADAAIGPDTGA
jgi:hypothetical protein